MSTRAAVILFLAASVGRAQTLQFEVATVKRVDPDSRPKPKKSGGPGTSSPGIISFQNSLKGLFMQAYDMRTDQVLGPDWMAGERFDILAKVPAGATADDMNGLLQKLLTERFSVKLHRETREFPAYAMVVAKGRLKLKPTAYPDAKPDPPSSIPLTLDKNDFPILPQDLNAEMRADWIKNGSFRSTFRAYSMSRLAQELASVLPEFYSPQFEPIAAQVVDRTGVPGRFDFRLEYEGRGIDASGPDIGTALENQLGLRLDKINLPQDVIVIDHIEKTPVEN